MDNCSIAPMVQQNALVEWLRKRLAEKNIPFALFNFEESPAWDNCDFVTIEGIKIPVLNSVTSVEKIVLDKVTDNQIQSVTNLQIATRNLATSLSERWADICAQIDPKEKDILKELRALKAVQLNKYILYSTSEDYKLVSETIAYQEWYSENTEAIGKVLLLASEMDDGNFTRLVQAIFFLAYRCGSAWLSPAKIQRLTESQVKKIIEFINRELNEGKDPLSVAKESEGN